MFDSNISPITHFIKILGRQQGAPSKTVEFKTVDFVRSLSLVIYTYISIISLVLVPLLVAKSNKFRTRANSKGKL